MATGFRSTSPPLSLASALAAGEQGEARLPDALQVDVAPTPVAAPELVRLNRPLARQLGLDPQALEAPEGVGLLAGNRIPSGVRPRALAYGGHQFGTWVPRLGDGRAVLLGQVVDREGVRRDVQLKGSGRTPFSRRGDGRAALGPVLREYIVSEAMAALGIPTTRALAALTTGEPVVRQEVEPGAVLVRVASSHVRIGTFQYAQRSGDRELLRQLADAVIARHDPELGRCEQPYRALLDAVIERTASLVAQWMGVGFIHGVMNTDNLQIAGETLDYGPCAFMDTYHPATVYSSIDTWGRYAYDQQPRIAHWNLARLAEALLPLLGEDEEAALEQAQAALDRYAGLFEAAHREIFLRKIGVVRAREGDAERVADLLRRMAEGGADFTLTFRHLAEAELPERAGPVRALFQDPHAFDAWAEGWRKRLAREPGTPEARRDAMRRVNPAFIPRNHRVERVLEAASRERDLRPLDELMAVLARPYDDQPERAGYAQPPRPGEEVRQTFCGT